MSGLSRLRFWRSFGKNRTRRPASLCIEELEDRTVPTLLGQQLFPSDNPWNQQITNAPVAANSTAIINNITTHYGNGRLHPDFGQDYQNSNDLYGIPYNVVHGNSTAKVNVVIDAYPGESDIQAAPIPAGAVIEGDFQNGPNVGVNNRGDSHLIVWDEVNNIDYEFYHASRPSENADGMWHADQETVWNMNTNTFRTLGYTSADAAGLPILPGLVRPDEGLATGQGGIDHAIRFTLQNSIILDQFLYPASHIANSGSNAAVQPPMGARFRLKASVDIATLNPESRIIAQAMQDYGMIVADNGSNFFFSGASYAVDGNNHIASTWDDNDIQDSVHGLKSLTFSDFEVVNLTPIVTGLSTSSGAAGTSVTVTGQNFSGAAGHLQVLFGNTPATSVNVIDDGHVTAMVPTGTGTVDVRVQSGATVPADSENVEHTIFGYGISAVTTSDRFTYGGASNQPPTVATAAAASPNPVTGNSTSLSVLGADDGGEANLTYTWTATGPAAVSFAANGTNAAKNTTATFVEAGTYHLVATITDAGGLSVTSSVNVTVAKSSDTTAVSLSSTTSVFGQPVTLFATLSAVALGAGTPTGTVTFYRGSIGGTFLGTGTLNGSDVAGLTLSNLPVGLRNIYASYTGDANFLASDSPSPTAVSLVVSQAGTTTTASLSSTTSVYGQPVTLFATVRPVAPGAGLPTGTVTFYRGSIGGTFLGIGTLNGSAVASLTLSNLPVGLRNIYAVYAGDTNFVSSNSPSPTTVSLIVSQAATTTAVSLSSTTSVYGQPVTLFATVRAVAPGVGMATGTVTFYRGSIGGIFLGTVAVNSSGTASLTLSNLPVGLRNIYASYGGDANFLAGNSPTPTTVSLIVNQAGTTTALSLSSATSVFGQPVTFSATVSPVAPGAGTPTGMVTFYDGPVGSGLVLGTGTLNASGKTSLVTSSLKAGTHTISARYDGDLDFTLSSTPLGASLTVS